jgi:hypothetical protein
MAAHNRSEITVVFLLLGREHGVPMPDITSGPTLELQPHGITNALYSPLSSSPLQRQLTCRALARSW